MQCLLCEKVIGKGRFVRPTFKCKDNIKVGSCRETVELNWMKMARRRFVVMISPKRRVPSREELFRFIFCSPFLFCNLFTSFSFLFPLYSFSISFLFVSECNVQSVFSDLRIIKWPLRQYCVLPAQLLQFRPFSSRKLDFSR